MIWPYVGMCYGSYRIYLGSIEFCVFFFFLFGNLYWMQPGTKQVGMAVSEDGRFCALHVQLEGADYVGYRSGSRFSV